MSSSYSLFVIYWQCTDVGWSVALQNSADNVFPDRTKGKASIVNPEIQGLQSVHFRAWGSWIYWPSGLCAPHQTNHQSTGLFPTRIGVGHPNITVMEPHQRRTTDSSTFEDWTITVEITQEWSKSVFAACNRLTASEKLLKRKGLADIAGSLVPWDRHLQPAYQSPDTVSTGLLTRNSNPSAIHAYVSGKVWIAGEHMCSPMLSVHP